MKINILSENDQATTESSLHKRVRIWSFHQNDDNCVAFDCCLDMAQIYEKHSHNWNYAASMYQIMLKYINIYSYYRQYAYG